MACFQEPDGAYKGPESPHKWGKRPTIDVKAKHHLCIPTVSRLDLSCPVGYLVGMSGALAVMTFRPSSRHREGEMCEGSIAPKKPSSVEGRKGPLPHVENSIYFGLVQDRPEQCHTYYPCISRCLQFNLQRIMSPEQN